MTPGDTVFFLGLGLVVGVVNGLTVMWLFGPPEPRHVPLLAVLAGILGGIAAMLWQWWFPTR